MKKVLERNSRILRLIPLLGTNTAIERTELQYVKTIDSNSTSRIARSRRNHKSHQHGRGCNKKEFFSMASISFRFRNF